MTKTINQTIANAFAATPEDYLQKTLGMRNPDLDTTAGSFFAVPQTIDSLIAADWQEFDPGAARFGTCRYFKAPIVGYLGIVPLSMLDGQDGYELQVAEAHGGAIAGMAELQVRSAFGPEQVLESTLIIGEHEGQTVVFTFHPGLPIAPDQISLADAGGVGPITLEAAKAVGFRSAKAVA